MVKNIKISDYDYELPDERIARHPLARRDACKLLVASRDSGVRHEVFCDVWRFLPGDSLMVYNDTRVINARIRFEKSTGSKIEVFLLEPIAPEDYVLMFQARGKCRWSSMVGNLKRWKDQPLVKELDINGRRVTLTATRGEARSGNAHDVEFSWDDDTVTFASIVDAAGYIPIPPYLKRDSEEADNDDYQTMYARIKGSVAAPTAGLHFTPEVFDRLRERGILTLPVTLHVGAGTFQPVKSEEIGGHPMHTEVFSVSRELVASLRDALAAGRPVTAVGTTSVRTLESLPWIGFELLREDMSLHVDQWQAYAGEPETTGTKEETVKALDAILAYLDSRGERTLTASTSIMIAPGFRWLIVDRMITNFHQPQSTLLLLVASFLGDGEPREGAEPFWRGVYDEAMNNGYRFLSYGDACLFTR